MLTQVGSQKRAQLVDVILEHHIPLGPRFRLAFLEAVAADLPLPDLLVALRPWSLPDDEPDADFNVRKPMLIQTHTQRQLIETKRPSC